MKKNISFLSNFNVENLYNFAENKLESKEFILKKPEFGSFYDVAFKNLKSKQTDYLCVVWTQIEYLINSFNKLMYYQEINLKELEKETDHYINILKQLAKKNKHVLVFSWVLPENETGKFLRDYTDPSGLIKNINFLNTKIANKVKKIKNLYLINSDRLIGKNNSDYNPKYWYTAKIPYSQKVFEQASLEICDIINAISGRNIKLIILDLDNTIWGGNVGDRGWKKIILGGHSMIGEAYKDFQKKLKSLTNLGIQLAISSKNDEEVALEAIEKNEEMILKKKDFVTWKINWEDKALNIKKIIKELNLTESNVLFLDDNIRERQRVKKSLKDIRVPELPSDPCNFSKHLSELGCFNLSTSVTSEDKKRIKFYKDNFERKKNRDNFLSEEKWLKSLQTKIIFREIDQNNIERIIQLLSRVNQMNLTTRRISYKDLEKLRKSKNNHMLCCALKDRYGEMGIIGFFNLELKKNKGLVKDLLLSCRAFGRGVEKSIIVKIIQILSVKNIQHLELRYVKTNKNKPCFDFLKQNFYQVKKNIFQLKNFKNFKLPNYISVN